MCAGAILAAVAAAAELLAPVALATTLVAIPLAADVTDDTTVVASYAATDDDDVTAAFDVGSADAGADEVASSEYDVATAPVVGTWSVPMLNTPESV